MPVGNLQPVQHRSLVDTVLGQLRRSIVNGELAPGERLMEGSLADRLGVSRVTIRHALHELQIEGLVDLRPRKGALITRMSEEVAFEVCQVRGALEGFAARYACRVLTLEQRVQLRDYSLEMGECLLRRDVLHLSEVDIAFHTIICTCAPNKRLVNQWSVHNTLLGALAVSMLERQRLDAQTVVEMHLILCDELDHADPDRAEAAVRTHYMGRDWEARRFQPFIVRSADAAMSSASRG